VVLVLQSGGMAPWNWVLVYFAHGFSAFSPGPSHYSAVVLIPPVALARWAVAVRKDWAVDWRSGFISLTAIPRWRAGLRGGALTGRRPLGLASLVARLFFAPW